MKACPTCNRTYEDDTLAFCLDDGARLSPANDPQATLLGPRTIMLDVVLKRFDNPDEVRL